MFVSQTRFIPGGPSQDELNSLKADAAAKLEKDSEFQNMGTEIMVVSSNLLKNKNSVRQMLIVKQITN